MAEQFARENEEIKKDQCTQFFTKFAQAHFSENEMIEIREILEEKLAKKEWKIQENKIFIFRLWNFWFSFFPRS